MRTTPTIVLGALLAALCAGSAGAAPAWTTHRDPRGWIVEVPPGWSTRYDATHHKLELDAGDGARAVVRVVTADQALDQQAGLAVGAALAKDADGAVDWAPPQLASSAIAVMGAAPAPRTGKAFFTWQSAASRSVGYLYAASGSPDALAREHGAIARIFASFRVAPPPDGARASTGSVPAQPALRYTTFSDPQEHMFTVELPAAWSRTGGTYRHTSLDYRPAYLAGIEGKALIRSGDPRIPFFAVPNPMLAMGGLREGSWYQIPGVSLMVRRFVDGPSFAREYAQTGFGNVCTGVSIDQQRPRPDAVAHLNETYARFGEGVRIQVTAGEVAFSCTSGGAPVHGYVFAATQLVSTSGPGLWSVPYLLAYVARPEYAAQAHDALDHAIATYRVDEVWAERNAQTARNVSEIARANGEAIAKIVSDTYWSNTERRTAAIESYDRAAVRGHQIVYDPVTRTKMEIDDRYEYNFMDHSGRIAGSDVSALPSPEFRRLIANP
jgi:hypothetical protein